MTVKHLIIAAALVTFGGEAWASCQPDPGDKCVTRFPNANDRHDHRVNGMGWITCDGQAQSTVQYDNYGINQGQSVYVCTKDFVCPNIPYPNDKARWCP